MTAASGTELGPSTIAVTDPAAARSAVPTARFWRFSGRQLDPRNNGLNLVRLVLAASVLFAHGYYIAGAGEGPHIDGDNVGGWAVFGFFAVSGYLITASRWSNTLGVYLVHRVARIFPAFLVCLVVMVAVFGPIGYRHVHGTLSGYLSTPTEPAAFVFTNALLRIGAYDIAGTPADVPYPGAWNGSLWTLYYEFLCYLIVGVLALVGWVRRHPASLALAWLASVALHAGWGSGVGTALGGNSDAALLFKLLPLFLGGALLQAIRHKVPIHWSGALLSLGLVLAAVGPLDGWGPQLTAPFIAYLLIWVGSVLPIPPLVRRHDISYGVYIYAFPVQQLLVLTGIHEVNLLLYDVVALACTVPLAVASWLVVERPAMRRARRSHGTPRPATPLGTRSGAGGPEGVTHQGADVAAGSEREGQQRQRVET